MNLPRFNLLMPVIVMLLTHAPLVLAFEEINKSYFGGVALDGYDAVSYFTRSKAVEGSKDYAIEWKGATWLFTSDANRVLFAADPEVYAPQYGGYCSNQMSLGNLSNIDAEVWRIIDNRLYLFGHDAGRVRWASETEQRISEADQHWRRYLAQ